MRRLAAVLTAVLIQIAVLAVGCVNAQAGPEWLEQVILDAETKPAIVHDEASVLVLHKTRRVEIFPDERAKTLVRIVVMTLKPRRVPPAELSERIATYQRMDKLRGWWISEDGAIEEIDPDKVSKILNPRGFREYGDDFIISATLPGVREASAFALEYEIEEQGWTSLFQGFVFQYKQPVAFARFSMKFPGGWQYRASGTNAGSSEASGVEYSSEGSWHHWTAVNLTYIPELPLAPPPESTTKRIMVSASGPGRSSQAGFEDWEGVASWYAGIASPTARPDEAVFEETRRIVQGVEGTPEEIQAIASFVQGIRYVALEIGEGRWTACRASETLANRYGDCKDKTSLTLAMLAARGIPAVPVLMNPHSTIRADIANPLQFSHVMAGIPVDTLPYPVNFPDATAAGWLFLDPSAEDIPFGALPVSAYGRLVLPCTADGGRLVRLSLPDAGRLNHRRFSVKSALNQEGDLSAEVVVVDMGYAAGAINRYRSRTPLDQQVAGWKSRILAGAPAPRVSDYQYAPHADSAWARFHVDAPAYAAGGDSIRLLKLDFLHAALAPAVIDQERMSPVYLGERRLVDFQVDWQIPEGWTMSVRDQAGTMETVVADADYHIRVIDDDRLRLRWTVRYTGYAAVPGQFEEVRGILEMLSNIHSLTVLLRRKDGISP
jgi:hypothetical protein